MMLVRLFALLLCVVALGSDGATQGSVSPPTIGPVFSPGHYPIFSSSFRGLPSPFHEPVASLILKGAKLQPPIVAENLWRQGLSTWNDRYRLPIFVSTPDQPTYKFSCVSYGKCVASGLRVHVPPGAKSSDDSDHHLMVVDDALGGELDGWGGDENPAHTCNLGGGVMTCSWGGFFPFSGNGLDGNTGDSANNGGYAFGLFVVTAQELLQGHIDHALGIVASCLDDPDIYPADTNKHTDTSCSKGTGNGNPQYGQLIHLKNSYDIAGSAYSPECKTYLTALQTYGAYTYDTNGRYGIAIGTEDTSRYANPNPWYTKLFPEMVRFGDGSGSGRSFAFPSCLNRLSASDIEVFDVAPGT